MSDTPLPEPLQSFLQQAPSLSPPAGLQDSVLDQTTAQLRRRDRWRRWPVLVGVAAGILLALVSAYFGLPSNDIELRPIPDLVERNPAPPPIVAAAPVSPLELENSAFDAEDDQLRVRLYFQAGDLYFEQYQDIESALRCYHQALQYGDARECEYKPDDNYLVMALKRDRRKEP